MIFVGYHIVSSYNLYDPVSKKIVTGRDVFMDEKDSWNR